MNELVKENVVLQMKNIHKNFTGVKALQAVDFSLREGEIHALMGENGAGKSTLIKVLTGVYEKDEGEIFLAGSDKAVEIHSPQDAQNLGISTVYQEITLCPNLSVAENMFIGRTKGVGQNWKKMNEDADKILKSLDIPAKATQQLASCSIAVQQMVAIARAVDMDCKVLILDEPTVGLDVVAREEVLAMIREYMTAHEQAGVLISSHIATDLESLCDDLYLIRDGKIIMHEDTDVLLSEYALLKVPAEKYETLDKQYILRSKKESYGYACLTDKKQYYRENEPDLVMENGSIDELILMMNGGRE